MKIKTLSILIIVIVMTLILISNSLFFGNFVRWGNEKIDILFEKTVAGIDNRINDEIKRVEDVSFNLSIDKSVQNNIFMYDDVQRVKGIQDMKNIMQQLTFNSKSILYTAVVMNGEVLCYHMPENASLIDEYIRIERFVADNIHKLEKSKSTFIGNYRHKDKVLFAYMCEIIPLNINIKPKEGCCVLVLFELDSYIVGEKQSSDMMGIEATLVDTDNVILMSNNGDLKCGDKYVYEKSKGIITKTAEIESISNKLILSTPAYSVLDLGEASGVFLIVVAIFTIAIFIFLMLTLFNIILKSILEIEKGAKKIISGDYNYRIKQSGKNEISNIAVAMNEMLSAVENANKEKMSVTKKLYKAELLQKQAEIARMQNQISPHFLYNSLEQINSIAEKSNAKEIVAITNILAKSFRYNLNDSEVTTVAEDMDYAFNYFNIINLRRDNPITVCYDLPDDILKLPVLKMVFQPILENIIKHAFKNKADGIVNISGYTENNYVTIVISDNGAGMDEETLQTQRRMLQEDFEKSKSNASDGGIGIMNVHNRLRLYYDDENCGISIESKAGEGTTVYLKIKR